MLSVSCVLIAVICSTLAAPQDLAYSQANVPQIVSQNSAVNADGSFSHSFETSDGIRVQESGYVKPGTQVASRVGADGSQDYDSTGDAQVIQGSFSYTAPDGTPISVSYTADETGFHPEGSHLPTPPPIPEAIQRSLDQQTSSGPQGFTSA